MNNNLLQQNNSYLFTHCTMLTNVSNSKVISILVLILKCDKIFVIYEFITGNKMLIEFQLEHRTIEVPYDAAIGSEYIKHTVEDTGTNNIIIPSKYSVLIFNYIDFLKGNDNPITNKNYLRDCLYMYNYFADPNYFSYLLKQLFDNWSYMFTIVYTDVPLELQREILLFCPYDFLPRQYIEDRGFFKQWNELNKNVVIEVNGNEQYYVNIETIHKDGVKEVVNSHTVNDHGIGLMLVAVYDTDGQILSRGEYKDHEKLGLWEKWYPNESDGGSNQSGQLSRKGEYNDNEREGLHEEWYKNGNMHSRGVYIHGSPEDLREEWYENGQLRYEQHYVNGVNVGLWKTWDESGKLMSEGHYVNNKKQGPWIQREFPLEDITLIGSYVDGKQEGLWESYHNDDGKPYSRGTYENNKRVGVWQYWYGNGHVTNTDYTNYVDPYATSLTVMPYTPPPQQDEFDTDQIEELFEVPFEVLIE